MRISVLIPTYNRREQVLQAIDSVLAQTAPVDEIIVVDDGSTDDTAEAIRGRYESQVKFYQQDNAGVSAARNRGIREARGEWIAFLDSDDTWLPTKIERQRKALAVMGSGFGLCFTDCEFMGNSNLTVSAFEDAGLTGLRGFGALEDPSKYILEYQLAKRTAIYIPSFLVLRSLLQDLNGFDEALALAEDVDLMFRLAFRTRFCFVAEPLVRIDRAPSRAIALCNLFSTRDDRNFESFVRLYTNWLAMPQVAGTEYEMPIRKELRLVHYSSTEAKIHEFRTAEALREISRLRAIGDSYPSIIRTLLTRKIEKMRRRPRRLANR